MIIDLDANFFKLAMDESISGLLGTGDEAIFKVLNIGYIVADAQGLIIQEWKDCAGAVSRDYVGQWIDNCLLNDRIRLIKTTGCSICRKEVSKLGVPSPDAKRISIYKSLGADVLISEDIDYFEPTEKKSASPRRRFFLMNLRCGTVCRYMEKSYSMIVCTHDYFYLNRF